MIAYQSTLQSLVPAETRGRAFALCDVLWNTAGLVSLAARDVVAKVADVRIVYAASGLLLATAATVGLTTHLDAPRSAKTDGQAPPRPS